MTSSPAIGGGCRTDLGKHGVGIDLRLSQFYQNVTSLFATQVLFDGKAAAVAGKLGSMDLRKGMFPSVVDYGLDGFMNADSNLSILSWERWLILSQYGVEAWTIEDGMPSTGVIVTEAENTSAAEDKKS